MRPLRAILAENESLLQNNKSRISYQQCICVWQKGGRPSLFGLLPANKPTSVYSVRRSDIACCLRTGSSGRKHPVRSSETGLLLCSVTLIRGTEVGGTNARFLTPQGAFPPSSRCNLAQIPNNITIDDHASKVPSTPLGGAAMPCVAGVPDPLLMGKRPAEADSSVDTVGHGQGRRRGGP